MRQYPLKHTFTNSIIFSELCVPRWSTRKQLQQQWNYQQLFTCLQHQHATDASEATNRVPQICKLILYLSVIALFLFLIYFLSLSFSSTSLTSSNCIRSWKQNSFRKFLFLLFYNLFYWFLCQAFAFIPRPLGNPFFKCKKSASFV